MKFKVGDRVRVVKYPDPECKIVKVGMVGRISQVAERYPSTFPYRVILDGVGDNYGQLFTEDELEPELRFKVGDKVKVIDNGRVGKITEVDPTCPLGMNYLVDYETYEGEWREENEVEAFIPVKLDPEATSKFKVGDRVKVISDYVNGYYVGHIGTVQNYEAQFGTKHPLGVNLVIFDTLPSNESSTFPDFQLELVVDEPEPKYKVGDRVIYHSTNNKVYEIAAVRKNNGEFEYQFKDYDYLGWFSEYNYNLAPEPKTENAVLRGGEVNKVVLNEFAFPDTAKSNPDELKQTRKRVREQRREIRELHRQIIGLRLQLDNEKEQLKTANLNLVEAEYELEDERHLHNRYEERIREIIGAGPGESTIVALLELVNRAEEIQDAA